MPLLQTGLLPIPFSSVTALEQSHARARRTPFSQSVDGLRNFCCKTTQFCATRRESAFPNLALAMQRKPVKTHAKSLSH